MTMTHLNTDFKPMQGMSVNNNRSLVTITTKMPKATSSRITSKYNYDMYNRKEKDLLLTYI